MGGFKLGRMTMRSLFSKPATTSYPFVPYEYVPGTRGRVVVDLDTCTFCGSCQRACPADAITVDRAANTWSINRFCCVQCGSCPRACRFNSLAMEPEYTPSATSKHADVYGLSAEQKAKREEADRIKKEKAAKAREEAARKKAEAEAAQPQA